MKIADIKYDDADGLNFTPNGEFETVEGDDASKQADLQAWNSHLCDDLDYPEHGSIKRQFENAELEGMNLVRYKNEIKRVIKLNPNNTDNISIRETGTNLEIKYQTKSGKEVSW
jgi:hypothetical protein